MKLTGGRIEAFLAAPDPKVMAVLVYGPDIGLVAERIERLAKGVVPRLDDPFRIADLTGAQLAEDPALLADEAAAISMTGGRRVVRVRGATDAAAPAFAALLAEPKGDALILAAAGELSPRSSLRGLFEAEALAAALPCYADQAGDLQGLVTAGLREKGVAIDPDAAAWLAEHLGSDRLATRSEIDKLALFKGGTGRLTLDEAVTAIGDGAALDLDEVALAAADGDAVAAQRGLDRLFAAGTQPVSVLRNLARHYRRLHRVGAALADGRSIDQALATLRPKPHFRVADRIKRQIRRWPPARVAQAMDLLLEAEIDCKTTGMPAEAVCGRAVLRLATAARRG